MYIPESVRVCLGCRNVDKLPGVAEEVLGLHFYDFFYDIDRVVSRDPKRVKSEVYAEGENDQSLNKKQKTDSSVMKKKDEEPVKHIPGKPHGKGNVEPEAGELSESDSEDISNSLLIESMA